MTIHDTAFVLFARRPDWQDGDEVEVWASDKESVRFYLKCERGFITLRADYAKRDLRLGFTVGMWNDIDRRWERFTLASEAGYKGFTSKVQKAIEAARGQQARRPAKKYSGEGLWVNEPKSGHKLSEYRQATSRRLAGEAAAAFTGLPDEIQDQIIKEYTNGD